LLVSTDQKCIIIFRLVDAECSMDPKMQYVPFKLEIQAMFVYFKILTTT